MKTRCRRRYYGVNAIKLQVLTAFCSLPDVRERHQPHCRGNGLPLNVMCMPDLPSFDRLKRAGVSRISMGNFVHSAMQSTLTDVMHAIRSRQTFEGLLAMKITDKNLCDIWYQALLERASDYTGVFLLASKPRAYSAFRYAGRESPSAKMSNFIKMPNLPRRTAFVPVRSADLRKMRTARHYSLSRRLRLSGAISNPV